MEVSTNSDKSKGKRLLDEDENSSKCAKIESDEESDTQDDEEPTISDQHSDYFNASLPFDTDIGNLNYKPESLEFPVLGKMVCFTPTENTLNTFTVSTDTPQSIAEFSIKSNLMKNIINTKPGDSENDMELNTTENNKIAKKDQFSPFQLSFYKLLSNYMDVIYMQRTHTKGEQLRKIYSLHIVNHIFKSRAQIARHNCKLVKNPDNEYRDQGFTKPTAVVLVPFRHDAYRIVQNIISLLPGCAVMNKKRFDSEFGPPPKKVQRMKKRPPDFDHTFEGNINEDFKFGLRILSKSITLYSKFYASDLIIASPLGLRQTIGAEGEYDRDYDFLSSVEILIVDRADVLYLQNFPHLLHVLKHFNLLPKKSHDCNFFRVRMYAIQGMAKYYRQTVLLSSVEHRWFESNLFRNFCFNHRGYLSSVTKLGSLGINQIYDTVKVVFRFFEFADPSAEFEDRFDFFVKKVLPDFQSENMAQTLIYIPSYFDFVRLRNHFRENEISAVMLCEYTKSGKVAQGRNHFFKGWRHFMLYTERCHFYNRFHIKGIQHLIFYQLPTYPVFFQEMNFAFKDSNPRRLGEEKSCTVLASRLDTLQLKSVVGLEELKQMLGSTNDTFIRYVKK